MSTPSGCYELKMARFFSQVYLSATDFSFYKKIARQKLSATFFYFLLLLFLVSVATASSSFFYVKSELERVVHWAEKHLPPITVRNGELSSTVEQPYTVADPQFVFILDTTGKVTRFDPQVRQGVLVMKDRVIIKREGSENQDFLLNWIRELNLDAPTLRAWKEKSIPVLPFFLFALFFVGALFSKTVQAFLFSFIVWVFSTPKATGLGMKEIFTLSLYAATPAILLSLLVQVLRLEIPYFVAIYFFMYAAFFVGAFMQCRRRENNEKDPFFEL